MRVSGTAPALGCGEPSRAVRMVTTPSTYPHWTTKEAIFLPGDTGPNQVMYRYAVFCGGQFKRWEGTKGKGDGAFTRTLDAPGSVHRGISVMTDDVLDILGALGTAGGKRPPTPQIKGQSTSSEARASVSTASEVRSFKSRQFEAWGDRCANVANHISSEDRVVVVSYFLPVILTMSEEGEWTAEWDNENILSLQADIGAMDRAIDKISWVGTVRYQGAAVPAEHEQAVSYVLTSMHCFPVYVSEAMHHQFYDVFCKQQLWMILHHVADVYGPLDLNEISAKAQQELWYTYSTVNRMFKEKVVEAFSHGDLIWIHGFHLMLLPSFLRRVITNAKIGYFFHTPFPSSEIWRTMSRREDLLRGILAADQVGFHLYEYARHFMTTCQRVLGHRSEMTVNGSLAINVDERDVIITCIHVGIDTPKLQTALKLDAYDTKLPEWREKFKGKTVVGGTDRLERLKGIPLKLIAIDTFMQENPQWHGKLLFSIIGISAAERGNDYRLTVRDVKIMAKAINAKYSTGIGDIVVHFAEKTERDFNLSQRLAYFSACDLLMVTATRDGLNRLPMEFILARHHVNEAAKAAGEPIPSCPGQNLVIVSEFISSARVMRGALTVNPWRVQDVTMALGQALAMGKEQMDDRFHRNLEYSSNMTTQNWAIQVLNDLKAIAKDQDQASTMAMGFGMGFKVMGLSSGFKPVDPVVVSKAYRQSRSRLIVLDWGGTLVADDDKTDKLRAYALATGKSTRVGPTMKLTKLIEKLASDVRNSVFIVSGKELMAVSEYFGHIKNVGLGAEHGFYYRWPRDEFLPGDEGKEQRSNSVGQESPVSKPDGMDSDDSDYDGSAAKAQGVRCKWQTLTEIGDQTWKESARLVMQIFVQRTHGTYVEEKGNALIWQFRDADPEFGFLQSKELEEHLKQILRGSREVEVIRGGGVADGYIEVRPAGVTKGLFLEHAMATLKNLSKSATFVLAIGDDSSDEPMFEQLQRLTGDVRVDAFGVTVGKKPSAAGSYVDDPAAVMELLNTLSRSSERDSRCYSSADLPSQVASQKSRHAWVQKALHEKRLQQAFLNPASPAQPPLSPAAATLFGTTAGTSAASPGGLKPEHRAMSVGNLSLASNATGGMGMQRTMSSAHLTMSGYLKSIHDNDNEGDDGIFF